MRDVDLDVAHGERRAILGPNGAGKTTLFNVISGDVAPSSGTIEFLGAGGERRCPPRSRAKLGMGRTYQKSRFFLGLTVEDNLYLADARRPGRPPAPGRPAQARRRDPRACPRARAGGRPRGTRAPARRLALTRRAAPARDRDGAGCGPPADDARRAGLGPVAWRARRTHGAPARARPEDHADPDRARHGRRADRRAEGDDDARRRGDRRGHAGRRSARTRRCTTSTSVAAVHG